MRKLRFEHKHCIITGGSKGIGKATADVLLKEGAKVYILARDFSEVEDFNRDYKNKVCFMNCDLSSDSEIRKAFAKIKSLTSSINTLINNAGTSENIGFDKLSLSEWEQVLKVNLTGMMLCCKYSLPVLKGGSSIVNVSSVRAEIPGTSVAYAASKAGVVGLTRALSNFFASRNIRVNCVLPGPTETGMANLWANEKREELIERTKLKRMASPQEIANVIAFLASDDASFITGASIRADGGFE